MDIGYLFVSLLAFGIGETAMIDNQLIAENLLQAGGELGSQRNLRNEIEYVLPLCQLRLNKMNIDICFSAGGYAMQEHNVLIGIPIILDFIDTFRLCGRQIMDGFNWTGIGQMLFSTALRRISKPFVQSAG